MKKYLPDQRPGELGIHFGALAPRIEHQLRKQLPKLTLPSGDLAILQSCCEAQVRLSVHGVLSDAEKSRVQKRLMRKITALVNKHLPC